MERIKASVWVLVFKEHDDSGMHTHVDSIKLTLLGNTFNEALKEARQLWLYKFRGIIDERSEPYLSQSFHLNNIGKLISPVYTAFKWNPSLQWNPDVLRNDIVSDLKRRDLAPTYREVSELINMAGFRSSTSSGFAVTMKDFPELEGPSLRPFSVRAKKENSCLNNSVTFFLDNNEIVRNIFVNRGAL